MEPTTHWLKRVNCSLDLGRVYIIESKHFCKQEHSETMGLDHSMGRKKGM